MGGLGSGRWGGKPTTGGAKGLDLARLRNGRGSFTWSLAGERVGSVGYELNNLALTLHYWRTDDDGNRQECNDRVLIVTTPAGFGGERRWLCCPSCARRCRVVYVGRYGPRCRKCYGLVYQSQREDALVRAQRRASRIVAQVIGKRMDIDPDSWPPKPKGMHWSTYWRLEERHCRLTNIADAALMSSLLARFG